MFLSNKKDRIIFQIFSLIIVFYQVFSETIEESERVGGDNKKEIDFRLCLCSSMDGDFPKSCSGWGEAVDDAEEAEADRSCLLLLGRFFSDLQYTLEHPNI